MSEMGGSPKLYTVTEVAAHIGKSKRWLQHYLRAYPCGRMAGRTRLFTEADLAKLIASFPDGRPVYVQPICLRTSSRSRSKSLTALLASLPNHQPTKHPRKKRDVAD